MYVVMNLLNTYVDSVKNTLIRIISIFVHMNQLNIIVIRAGLI